MIDFQPWEQLLNQYVDSQGRVNYQAWSSESAAKLNNWLSEISRLDLERNTNTNERLALWINLYNALVIKQILQLYPLVSIRPKILGVPNWIAFFWFFLRPVYSIGDRTFSLYQIEHQILRCEFKDPRIHFAIVCASIGCPLLRNKAYMPDTIQAQLEADAFRFINNTDKVKYDFKNEVLYCSQIFKWYRQDFLSIAPSVSTYISSYLQTYIPIDDSTPIKYLYYDWNLNQIEN